MRKTWRVGLSLMLAVSMSIGTIPMSVQAKNPQSIERSNEKKEQFSKGDEQLYAEGEAIIMYDKKNAKTTAKAIADVGNDVEIIKTYEFEDTNASVKSIGIKEGSSLSVSLVKSNKLSTEQLVRELSNSKGIISAEPNYRIKKMDTGANYDKYQWALDNKGQNAGTPGFDTNAGSLSADAALEEDKVIALVDTGIDYNHEDLSGAVWNNPNTDRLKGEHGYDFINYDDDPLDDNGHGSHCAGIMAATIDEKGISGVADNKNVKIMGLKILDAEGYGYGMEAVGAYNYIYKAQSLGVDVVAVNNSWGGLGEDSIILESLINMVGAAGAISVCASGNESNDNDAYVSLPSCLDSEYIISVAASNENDELAAFSNYGANNVDIAAPGTDILSTVSYECFNPGISNSPKDMCVSYQDYENKDIEFKQIISDNEYIEDEEESAENSSAESESEEESAEGESEEGSAENESAELIPYGFNVYATDEEAELSLELVDDDYFGPESSGTSLKCTIKNAKAKAIYDIVFPYTVKEDNKKHNISVMAKVTGPDGMENINPNDIFAMPSVLYVCDAPLDEKGVYDVDEETYFGGDAIALGNNYWNHYFGPVSGGVKAGDQRALCLQVVPAEDGEFVINLDDFGISKAGVSEFVKYDYYNGTSMATPHVTGAVAALSAAYPEEEAYDIKMRTLGSTRYSESLEGLVSTSGVLDLSKANNPRMVIDSVTMIDGDMINISGVFLSGAAITVNGETVEVIENEDGSLMFDGSQYKNKTITINADNGTDNVSVVRFFSDGKPFEKGITVDGSMSFGNVVSDGNALYLLSESGAVFEGVPYETDGKKAMDWTENELGEFYPYVFGEEYSFCVDYSISCLTEKIYGGNAFWTVAMLDVGYASETALLCFDKSVGWTKIADIPTELVNTACYSIGYYNGEVYLFGGYDNNTEKLSTKVYKYSSSDQEWKESVALPEGRILAKALQVNDKLVVTLGGSDGDNQFDNLIFDGKEWKKSKACFANTKDCISYTVDEKEIQVVDAQIGLVNNGIMYTASSAESLGDTFIYNIEKDTFESAGYMLDENSFYYDYLYATTVQNDLYVISGFEEEVNEEWNANKNTSDDEMDEEWNEDSVIDGIELRTMPIETGFVQVIDESEEHVQVVESGYHIAGDELSLHAEVEEDYFMTGISVDGEALEATEDGEFIYTIPYDKESITVAAQVGAYVAEINLPETKKVAPGESVQLAAEVLPANAECKDLVWYTEDESIALVDENGKVTVSKDAEIGTQVKICVTADDRQTVTAKCIIEVAETTETEKGDDVTGNEPGTPGTPATPGTPGASTTPETPGAPSTPNTPTNPNESTVIAPAEGSKVQVGKYTYKVLTNSDKSKTVAFNSVNNKKATSVTVPATVKIGGKTFMVTEVAAGSFKNCTKLKNITIGKNVTSIGKNAFKGCKSLKKITVKSTKIKKIASNKTSKNIVVKVPKSVKNKYKKLFKKAKFKATIK